MDLTAELVVDAHAELGEGPCWHEPSQRLLWVDIIGKRLHVYDPVADSDRVIQLEQFIGTVAPRRSGGVVLALDNGIVALDLDSEAITPLVDPEADCPDNRFNDGKCDPAGRFWAGTLHWEEKEPLGALYRLDADGNCHKMLGDITVSNGLTWSLDNKVMYYIDSVLKRVDAFDYDVATGAIANRRTVVRIPEDGGYPDGMTIDVEGKLWVAEWDAYRVCRWDPENGKCLQVISVPSCHSSACTFGGPDLNELYITSAAEGMDDEELAMYPHSGGLFKVTLDVQGLPAYEYAG